MSTANCFASGATSDDGTTYREAAGGGAGASSAATAASVGGTAVVVVDVVIDVVVVSMATDSGRFAPGGWAWQAVMSAARHTTPVIEMERSRRPWARVRASERIENKGTEECSLLRRGNGRP